MRQGPAVGLTGTPYWGPLYSVLGLWDRLLNDRAQTSDCPRLWTEGVGY